MIRLENGKNKLYQWDLNQRLVVSVKAGTQVHFASDRDDSDNALPVLSYAEDGLVYANIPNVMLQIPGIINVYIYTTDGATGYTTHHFKLRVVEREKPADYVYTETEVLDYRAYEKIARELCEESKTARDEAIVAAKEAQEATSGIRTTVVQVTPNSNGNMNFPNVSHTLDEILAELAKGKNVVAAIVNDELPIWLDLMLVSDTQVMFGRTLYTETWLLGISNAEEDPVMLIKLELSDMVGATGMFAGESGLVPVPGAGQQDHVLHGDGTWRKIPSGSNIPINYLENPDKTNKRPLRDLESGMYILQGYFTAHAGSTASFTFSTGMLVSVVHTSTITYVQIFYAKYNTLQYIEITDDSYIRNDAKLVNMESTANKVTEITEDATDEQYPSAKAVYDALSNSGGNSTSVRIAEVTLNASSWVGDKSPYSQVVNITGTTERSQVDLTPSVEQLAIFYEKDLGFVTENVDGVVTVYAIGQKPQNDYVIQVTITEVNT